MKVLQIYNRPLGAGGEEVVVKDIEKAFGSSGEISTLYLNSSDWVGPNAPAKWKQAAWTVYNPHSAAVVREMQKKVQADAWLFHGTYPVGSPSLYREALQQKVPVLQFIHNFRPFSVSSYINANDTERLRQSVPSRFWREIKESAWQHSRVKTGVLASGLFALHKLKWLRAVKAWIATTNFMRDRFVEFGIPREDIFVLRYMWQPIAEPPRVPEGDYYVFLGRLMDDKGVRVLCEAWSIIREKLGPTAPRLVIGGSGPLEQWVHQQTQANPLISFNGPIWGEEKTNLLAGCRAMIAPSLCFESLGLVTYDAYNFSKPMLAARSGGLGETVQHGSTGLLHHPGNASELAEHVIQLEQSADLRHAMGQNGRQWLLNQPTPKQWMEQFARIVHHAKQS